MGWSGKGRGSERTAAYDLKIYTGLRRSQASRSASGGRRPSSLPCSSQPSSRATARRPRSRRPRARTATSPPTGYSRGASFLCLPGKRTTTMTTTTTATMTTATSRAGAGARTTSRTRATSRARATRARMPTTTPDRRGLRIRPGRLPTHPSRPPAMLRLLPASPSEAIPPRRLVRVRAVRRPRPRWCARSRPTRAARTRSHVVLSSPFRPTPTTPTEGTSAAAPRRSGHQRKPS